MSRICDSCDVFSDDPDVRTCTNCGGQMRELTVRADSDPPTAPPPSGQLPKLVMAPAAGAPAEHDADSPAAETPADDLQAQLDGLSGTGDRPAANQAAPDAAAAAADDKPAAVAPTSGPVPPPPAPADAEVPAAIEDVLAELRELSGRKPRPLVIGLIGASTMGKTWFLERLKRELDDDYEVRPPFRGGLRSGAVNVGRTHGVSLHRFTADAAALSFRIVDFEGELLRIEGEAGFTGQNRNLLEVLTLCDAYLFVMPAAEYLFTRDLHARGELLPGLPANAPALADADRERINNDRADRIGVMHRSLTRLATAIGYIESRGGLEAALADGIDPARLERFLESRGRPSNKPAALILTMADRMQPAIDRLPGLDRRLASGADGAPPALPFDADPVPVLMHLRADVLKRLSRTFRFWRVDFSTACGGHPGGETADFRDDNHLGVVGAIQWFRDARREAAAPPWLLPGSSALAVWARRLVDPQFGARWTERVTRRKA